MKTINDGGPAFPASISVPPGHFTITNGLPVPGMSLRDYFASAAMQSLLVIPGQMGDLARGNPTICSCWSYDQADAMIAERETREKTP